ncbi:MAG: response regulator transcription factor [Prevotellaceae bacterium]|jgi:DNA-binding NarL/FixJ family response regulator|nr:response regulator transcription factor [Prevotellaceae bacterium]
MDSDSNLKIIIVEPSPVIQTGLKQMIESNSEYTVFVCFCDFELFMEAEKTGLQFDILLINPAVISFYRQFSIRNMFENHPHTFFVAIIYGYVSPQILENFNSTLDIYEDETKIVYKLQQIMRRFDELSIRTGRENVDLSDREKEILVLIAKGMTNREIAEQCFLSIHTIVSHRKNIARKTGIRTVSGLTVYAVFNNLLSYNDLSDNN